MHIKRFDDAEAYEAPNHQGCTSLRLAGVSPMTGRPDFGSAAPTFSQVAARARMLLHRSRRSMSSWTAN